MARILQQVLALWSSIPWEQPCSIAAVQLMYTVCAVFFFFFKYSRLSNNPPCARYCQWYIFCRKRFKTTDAVCWQSKFCHSMTIQDLTLMRRPQHYWTLWAVKFYPLLQNPTLRLAIANFPALSNIISAAATTMMTKTG